MNFAEPEGATPLDPDERRGLKFPHVPTRGSLDELEQANIEKRPCMDRAAAQRIGMTLIRFWHLLAAPAYSEAALNSVDLTTDRIGS